MKHKIGLLCVAALALACAIAVCGGVQQADVNQRHLQGVTAAVAFEVLAAAYEREGSRVIDRGECDGFGVVDCPALLEVRRRWAPVWDAYDAYAASLQGNDMAAVGKAYCALRAAVTPVWTAAERLPAEGCSP
jgi:hypothetical protein